MLSTQELKRPADVVVHVMNDGLDFSQHASRYFIALKAGLNYQLEGPFYL